jgi:hypothetical protein
MTDQTVQMTDISFTEAHLRVIEQALEVYTRLRLGQFDYALSEAFPDACLGHNERDGLHRHLRSVIFPEPPRLAYDGHGGYYDQYGNTYNENQELDSAIEYEMKYFLERAKKMGIAGGLNSSYGIGNEKVGNGSLAYEIRQTIRQYLAVKRNDGYFEHMYVTYDDPCKVTKEPLPIIKGFTKEKIFVVKNKKINERIDKCYVDKEEPNWPKMWELVEKNCGLPDNIESSRRRLNRNQETNQWELILEKPTKKLKSETTF